MEELTLDGCGSISHSTMMKVCSTPTLKRLYVRGDMPWSEGCAVRLKKCCALEVLDISAECWRTGATDERDPELLSFGWDYILSITSLKELRCRGRPSFMDDSAQLLSNHEKIEHVDAFGCRLSGRGVAEILKVKQLKYLDVGLGGVAAGRNSVDPQDRLTPQVVQRLLQLPLLHTVGIAYRGGLDDDAVFAWVCQGKRALRHVDVRGCSDLTNVACHWFSQCKSIESINLIDCSNISRDGIYHLSKLRTLSTVEFGGVAYRSSKYFGDVLSVLSATSRVKTIGVGLNIESSIDWDALPNVSDCEKVRIVSGVASGSVQEVAWNAIQKCAKVKCIELFECQVELASKNLEVPSAGNGVTYRFVRSFVPNARQEALEAELTKVAQVEISTYEYWVLNSE
ncbi:MAG: hypothetical protein IPK87_00645 [Planctomycetes bacterium]|nr:hypothetical protein [Planctomycetota bacterium]